MDSQHKSLPLPGRLFSRSRTKAKARRRPAHRFVRLESLEDRRLLATLVEVEIVAVATASQNGSDQLPTSLTQVDQNDSFIAEIWWRDVGSPTFGIAGGYVDVQYPTALLDASNLVHQDYTVLTSGSVNDPAGLIDDFGGGTFNNPAPGQSPKYARLGYFTFTATAAGTAQITLEPGSLQISRGDFNNVTWDDVDLGSLNLTIINHPPVAQASSVTTLEDTAKTFAATDFQFTDAEGDGLASITVTGLALASGDTLTVDQGSGAIAVTNGMTITAAQIPSLTYTPATNANGNARSTFEFKVNDAGAGVVAATMTINVTPDNDVPVAQPSSVTTLEDNVKTFAVADFQFFDVEGDSLASITVSGLALASGDALTVDQGSGPVAVANGMTITAAQIPSITYTPALNANGNARSTFDFKVNDADAGVVAASMSIHVTPVNDLPVAMVSSVTTPEDIAKSFAVADFQYFDVEGDQLASITVSGLSLASGDTLTVDQGSGPVAVTDNMTITAAQIPSLAYTSALNANGNARSTFDFTVNDADLGVVSATMTIHVTPVNDLPVAMASSVTTLEDNVKTFAVADFQYSDVEGDPLSSITVSGLALASSDTLTVDQGSGPVAVTNGMTITAAQIPSLTYTPAVDANGNARSTFDFKVNDADAGVVAASMSIHVTPVNDVPVAMASSVTTLEDNVKTFAVADFQYLDVEGDALASITVSGLSLASGDTLTVDQGSGPVVVTNGMTITAAQIPSLNYTPAANANGNARSTFDFKVNDADAGVVAATMSIHVTPVNDLPVALASSVTTLEDNVKTFAVADFQYFDVEGDPLASITVSGLSLASGDTLTVDQGSGAIAVTNGMTITAAQIPSLTYTPAANANGNGRSAFDFKVNDAEAGVVAATMTINVTPENDVPVAQPSSVTTLEDNAKTFAVADFQYLDVEGDSLASITVSGLALASGDTLTVDQGSGPVAVTNGMTITAAQIPSITYTPALNANGNARSTFDFKVNDADLGVVAATMSVHVAPVNDLPEAMASSVTTPEDIAKTFAVADFQYFDVEGDPLASITVSGLSLASGDTLTVDQGSGPVAVTDNMTITAAQIPSLTYTSALNANGNARSTFDFKVNDADAGVVVATMTIHVTPVNDLPVAQDNGVMTLQNTALTFAVGDFPFTDVEGDSLASITVSGLALASGDTLTVDQGSGPVAVTNGMTITAAQIPSLTYTPAAGASGDARSTFDFRVNDADPGVVAATLTINVTPGALVDLIVVTTPTSTDANGEVSSLPANETWVDEWETWYVEIWISTPETNDYDVLAASLDLIYNSALTTAQQITYGPAFSQNQTGSISDATGTVTNLGASTPTADLGDDKFVLLARVRFGDAGSGDGAGVDEANKFAGPYALNIDSSNRLVNLGDGLAPADPGTAPATEMWPVIYDVNDSDVIDFADFALFSQSFGLAVGGTSPPTWWADFNKTGSLVDFADFAAFSQNFAKSSAGGQAITFPATYPDAWRPSGKAGGNSAGGDGGGVANKGDFTAGNAAIIVNPQVSATFSVAVGTAETAKVKPLGGGSQTCCPLPSRDVSPPGDSARDALFGSAAWMGDDDERKSKDDSAPDVDAAHVDLLFAGGET